MKKLDWHILKSFLGPLLLTFVLSVFVLLMQFVWKYIDDMVGKGLEFGVIAELLLYASATFVPMALPIAILFASIMTMGNFGEKYELVAMKAGGVSVARVMMPLTLVALCLTGLAFYFANNVMPSAMYKYKSTLYDVTRKKPAVNIRPSQYYSEIEGYVIRANEKEADDRTLRDIIIYDHSQGIDQTNIIVAERGFMQSTPDNNYLIFTLYNGYTYSEPASGKNYYARPLTRIGFDEQELTFDISSFAFSRSNNDLFAGNYRMMNVVQLDTAVRQLNEKYDHQCHDYCESMLTRLQTYRIFRSSQDTVQPQPAKPVTQRLADMDSVRYPRALRQAQRTATTGLDDLKLYAQSLHNDSEYINRHHIEWQRKYSLSFACLLLFLIGAPFGSIVRKGGLGMPLVASVVFFVLYYVVGMIAEKMVREGAAGPIGMWYSTFVFIPIGIFLTLQATTDSAIFDSASWKKFFSRLFIKQKNVSLSAETNEKQ
ncbi:MAG: LptF/LptG family permease [Bacteroidales bacterium]|nr:LptF/LptG family permease [Bacteroidales bacterium]